MEKKKVIKESHVHVQSLYYENDRYVFLKCIIKLNKKVESISIANTK